MLQSHFGSSAVPLLRLAMTAALQCRGDLYSTLFQSARPPGARQRLEAKWVSSLGLTSMKARRPLSGGVPLGGVDPLCVN
jgi:hypothetical protein